MVSDDCSKLSLIVLASICMDLSYTFAFKHSVLGYMLPAEWQNRCQENTSLALAM